MKFEVEIYRDKENKRYVKITTEGDKLVYDYPYDGGLPNEQNTTAACKTIAGCVEHYLSDFYADLVDHPELPIEESIRFKSKRNETTLDNYPILDDAFSYEAHEDNEEEFKL